MTDSIILTNAKIVLPTEVICGTVEVRSGAITDVQRGRSNQPSAIDFDGDYMLPGIVELHTDNFERHMNPRPNVRWPSRDAVIAHDAQIASAGITTVFDAISIGDLFEHSPRIKFLDEMVDAIREARLDGALRAEHMLHLRCELTFARVVEALERLSAGPLVNLVSIMDHSPGQRQFADIAKYRAYYKGKHGLDDASLDDLTRRHIDIHHRLAATHRRKLVEICNRRHIPMASHDDETEAHVEEAASEGMAISEFPTTVAAARTARKKGMKILMGAPNVVLGGSQSGNISARTLHDLGLLDLLSSDYVPSSLVQAAFKLAREPGMHAVSLPEAVSKITLAPAHAAGLNDRGEITPGKRADLVRVHFARQPTVRCVWRAGVRII